MNAVYSFIIGSLALRQPAEVWRDVKATSWPALRTSWRFWPFVHTISFSHAVPLDLKLLWVDVMEVVWVTLLSKVANDDKEAAKVGADSKRERTSEVCIVDEALVLGEVDPAVAVAMTVELEEEVNAQNIVKSGSDWPKERRLLSRYLTPRGSQLLVAKSWRAAWPFAAMWPFLFLGHEVEVAMMYSPL